MCLASLVRSFKFIFFHLPNYISHRLKFYLLVVVLTCQSTASFSQSQDAINLAQQMYVAYYGRPGDPGGANYWAGQFDASNSLEAVLSAFGDSEEYIDNFGPLSNQQLVNGLFQQMFNRDSDSGGLVFYVGRLESGEATLASIAKQIADGVQGDDHTILSNKIEVANSFTNLVDSESVSYTGADIDSAQALLQSVSHAPESLTASLESVIIWIVEQKDLDGDGVSDLADAFPDDPAESFDTDGDGIGDNGDLFPNTARNTDEVEGIARQFEVTFSFDEGFDAIDTSGYEKASQENNLQFSTLSDCYFMWVPGSPDGRITVEYSQANIAYCASENQDVIGRIDFPEPVEEFGASIVYFGGGVVTFEAYSEAGQLVFEMDDQDIVGFSRSDIDYGVVSYVLFKGNHENAAINVDDLKYTTAGVTVATFAQGRQPLLIDSSNFEPVQSAAETPNWRVFNATRGAYGDAIQSTSAMGQDVGSIGYALRYPIVFEVPGRYQVYLRSSVDSQAATPASVLVSHGSPQSSTSGFVELAHSELYQWHAVGTIDVTGFDTNVVTDLYVQLRSKGIRIDEILVMPEGSYDEESLSAVYLDQRRTPSATIRVSDEFEWTQFRGNRGMTSHSKLVGNLSGSPVIKASIDYSYQEALVSLDLDDLTTGSIAPFAEDISYGDFLQLQRDWRYQSPVYAVDSNGTQLGLGTGWESKHGDFLQGNARLERVLTSRADEWIEYSHFDGEDWVTQWRYEGPEFKDISEPIIGDFDRDGEIEVAAVPWYNLHVWDLQSGVEESVGRFIPELSDNGRPYGWFGAVDLGGDDRDEFIIVADFHNHIEVLDYDENGELTKRWDWLIENGISEKQTIVHPGVNPVGEVIPNNNGRELVVSVFNASGDEKWHTLVLDGMSGELIVDLADYHLSRLYDLDADGVDELLLTPTSGRLVSQNAGVQIVSYESGHSVTLFELSEGSFAEYDMQNFPDAVQSQTGKYLETPFIAEIADRNPIFATRHADGGELEFWQAVSPSGQITRIATVTGENLKAVGFDAGDVHSGEILIRSRSFDSAASMEASSSLAILNSQRAANYNPELGTVAGDLGPGAGQSIVVDTGIDTLTVFGMDTGSLEARWSVSGRSSTQGAVSGQGLLLANVDGTQGLELIASDAAENGAARVTAYLSGERYWSTIFGEFQGERANWNENGLLMMHAGYFNSTEYESVLIGLRRSTMHSDESRVLDGLTGEELWSRSSVYSGRRDVFDIASIVGEWTSIGDTPQKGRGAGGYWSAIHDFDRDGYEDVVGGLGRDGIAVFSGRDGSSVVERFLIPIRGDHVAIPQAGLLYPTEGENRNLTLFTSMGVVEMNTELGVTSQGPQVDSEPARGVLADLNGDGLDEIVAVGDESGTKITVYDNQLNPKWSLPWTTFSIPSAASADFDNDGRDELLYVDQNTLKLVEEFQGDGQISWTWASPNGSVLSAPTLADVDEDGVLDIVTTAGGILYVLGSNGAGPMPDAAEITSLPEQAESGAILLNWSDAAYTTEYFVAISDNEGMTSLIEEQTLPVEQSESILELSEGQYWIKIQSRNAQGSTDSTVRQLTVMDAVDRFERESTLLN